MESFHSIRGKKGEDVREWTTFISRNREEVKIIVVWEKGNLLFMGAEEEGGDV